MNFRPSGIAVTCVLPIVLGACIGPFGRDRTPPPRIAPPPQVLTTAPVAPVTSTPLPPPGGTDLTAGTQVAAVDPGAGASGSVEVTRTDLLGSWTIASGGDSCQLSMTLTTWSGGYRASTRGCTNPALQKVSAWNMEGKQILLLDDSGGTVARLYASSRTQYTGTTAAGGPVTFSR